MVNLDTIRDELQSVTASGIKIFQKLGIEGEIYASRGKNTTISLQGGLTSTKQGISEGIGVSVMLDKRAGFSSTSSFAPESMEFAINEAIKLAKAIDQKDDRFQTYPSAKPPGKEGTLYPELLEISAADVVQDIVKGIHESQMKNQGKMLLFSGSIAIGGGAFAIANTEGIDAASRSTGNGGHVQALMMEGQKRKMAFDIAAGRSLADYSDLARKSTEKVIKMFESKPYGRSNAVTTIWDPFAFSQYLATCGQAFSGNAVVEGNSVFADKMGAKISSEVLTIVDDHQFPEGLQTDSIDAEGIPAKSTTLIEKGILKSFLFNDFYGKIHGTESTGNSSRGGSTDFESMGAISPSNVNVSPGLKKHEDLISEIDDGVLIAGMLMGMVHTNATTGDFSITALESYEIKDGAVSHPLDPIAIAGNVYKGLNDLKSVSLDRENIAMMVSGYIPYVIMDGFTLSG